MKHGDAEDKQKRDGEDKGKDQKNPSGSGLTWAPETKRQGKVVTKGKRR